ncbi:MAG TPA: SelB C-terminal domain-containing protein, partial [candidate division Zixibacteria bacterium]|nr:SelB C-terminal domain-containing protein [candidate division Zixibacteria bacterium]
VDSVSQRGLDVLKSEIDSLVATLTPRRDIGHPRLYVDRVFSIAGRGAVVTGTLIDGSFKLGQSIQVAPSGKSGRIRDLQIHKTHVDEAAPGQRVAVNVSGLDLDELRRGDCLTVADAADVTDRLWAQVTIWSEATQPLKPGRPVLVMLGTSEPEAEAYPVGGELIAPGTSGLCELRLHEPIVARLKDRFVLRWPTPQVTIGGGEVLEVGGTKRSHREPSFVASLRARVEGDLKAFILSQLQRTGFTPRAAIIPNSPWSTSEIDAQLEALMAADALIKSGTLYFDREWFDGAADRLLTVLTATHKKQPQSPGLNLSEWGIRARVPDAAMTGIAAQLISDGKVARSGDAYHLSTHAAKLPDEWREIEATLWEKLTSAGMQPPTRDELEQSAPHARAIVQFWIGAGRVKTLGDGLIFASETFSEIRKRVIAALKKEGALTASQLRDVLGTTRKYAVPIGEALDHEGLTQREGDVRVLVVDHRQEKESP